MITSVPFRRGGVLIGMAIIWIVILNALIFNNTVWGWEPIWTWSPLLVFVGVLLVTFSWQDHLLATLIAGVVAFLWWWFIMGGM